MAIRWDWNEKCGEATLVQRHDGEDDKTFTLSLYTGNCCLIFLHEFVDESGTEKYSLTNFWADKDHMKNCLGLNKKQGYGENIYDTPYERFTKFRLNKAKCRYMKDIVAALVQAFDNIDIEIYKED